MNFSSFFSEPKCPSWVPPGIYLLPDTFKSVPKLLLFSLLSPGAGACCTHLDFLTCPVICTHLPHCGPQGQGWPVSQQLAQARHRGPHSYEGAAGPLMGISSSSTPEGPCGLRHPAPSLSLCASVGGKIQPVCACGKLVAS